LGTLSSSGLAGCAEAESLRIDPAAGQWSKMTRRIHLFIKLDGGKSWKLALRAEEKGNFYFDAIQASSDLDARMYYERLRGINDSRRDVPGLPLRIVGGLCWRTDR
jgi:hypothetical protein